MKTKTKPQSRIKRIEKVWTPDAELYIPHEDKEITFAYPSFGPDTYQSVGKQILEHNLEIPTAEQTASLLYSAYFSDEKNEPEFENIRDVMRNRWLWIFNRKLWTDKGVYTKFDPEAKGINEQLDIKNLEKKLRNGKEIKGIEVRFSEDNCIRFAPKGSYKLGDHTPESLAKDGNVISEYGEEGAEKLGEIAAQFKYSLYLYGLNIIEPGNHGLRVSALGDGDVGLPVVGYGFDDSWGGHSFGVLR